MSEAKKSDASTSSPKKLFTASRAIIIRYGDIAGYPNDAASDIAFSGAVARCFEDLIDLVDGPRPSL